MARKKKDKKVGQLPSGNIRVRVLVGKRRDGTMRYESFTAPTKDQAQLAASSFKIRMRTLLAAGVPVDDIPREEVPVKRTDTVQQYLNLYIDTCEAAGLSPSTLKEYMYTAKRALTELKPIPIGDLTIARVQEYVNRRARDGVQAKTIRNEVSMLVAAIRMERPEINMRALRFPKQERKEIQIPTTEEVQKMLTASKGTPLFVPLMLAALMGLRRSEICALVWSDVDLKKKTLHVHGAMVRGTEGFASKGTKTAAGTRTLAIPTAVARALAAERGTDPRVTQLTPDAITRRYERMLEDLDLHYRFHDLRHYHASAMLAAGAPEKYITADMGHSTMEMVHRVYGHVMQEKQVEINEQMDAQASAFAL